jgi:hypothetical protein
MPGSHQNWQYLGANGFQGAYTTTGGNGTPIVPRSNLDMERLGIGRTPEAEYPDGYLGTIRSRRDDKGKPYAISDNVLDSLKSRQNQRAYQRGVHKGERIDTRQYTWPGDLKPNRRLNPKLFTLVTEEGATTMNVLRHSPNTHLAPPPKLVNDGKANISANVPAEFHPRLAQQFSHLKPKWI